jgi:hypothetical protein
MGGSDTKRSGLSGQLRLRGHMESTDKEGICEFFKGKLVADCEAAKLLNVHSH